MTSRTIDKHCAICKKYLYSDHPRDYVNIKKVVYCNAHTSEEIKRWEKSSGTTSKKS